MSVVCAKAYPDRVVMAADSQVTSGGYLKDNVPFNKIKQINGMIIGTVGECAEASLMWHYACTHKPDQATEKDILSFMVEFAQWKKDYDTGTLTNYYIIAYKGKLFRAHGIFVVEITDFAAIGCGRDYALAALYLGHSPTDATRIACKLDCFVGEPIVEYTMPKGE